VSSERQVLREKFNHLDPLEGVIGYQPLVLAQETECTSCKLALAIGDRGWLGLTAEPGPRVIVCGDCVPAPNSSGKQHPTTRERPS
jgi:hypothetical protein